MTSRDSREELQKWFSEVDELLTAEREHAISPSTVAAPSTEPAVWKMRLSTLRRDLIGLIDLLVSNPGRWILILCVGPHKYGRYVQLLVCEDGSIVAEACSNNFLEGSDRLSSEEERSLVTIGWKEPRPPDKPNWWAVWPTIHPDTKEVAHLLLGTLEGVYALCGAEMITCRLFSSPKRGSTPASRAAHPAQFVTPSGGTASVGPYKWSDAFHRSRLSPVVFVVAKDFIEPVHEVLEANSVPFVHYGDDYYHGAASLLEGMVISLTTFGFPAGRLSSGWRVLGYRPMRLLCLLMGLEPPRRRLLGEHSLATREELLEDLSWQRDEPRAQLEERANRGLGVIDRVGLLVLVRELFGEEYLPTPISRDLKAVLPAVSSRWALAGFNRLTEEELPAAGIDVEEAIAWRELGVSKPYEIIEAHPYGTNTIREWVKAGFELMDAVWHLRKGRTLDQLTPYLAAGCPPNCVDHYLEAGFGPEVATRYADAGFGGLVAARFAGLGLLPDVAKRWRDLGINPLVVQHILAAGGTLEKARQLRKEGFSVPEIVTRLLAGKSDPPA